MKMLVVDDSMIMRNKISRSANNDIDIVAQAANGIEALERFEEHKPDLVTLDITMPELDGLECLERILKINEDARVLVISALADKATAIQALKQGASGFLCKPFNDAELNEAIIELVSD